MKNIGYSFSQRDTHHWDVYFESSRAFRIRGEPGKIIVFDEREDDFLHGKHPRGTLYFPDILSAKTFCSFQLMTESNI